MTQRGQTLARLSLTLWSWCALVLTGCNSCRNDGGVAELVEMHSSVERDHAESQSVWTKAEPGARFKMGDALRTGSAAHATLSLTGQQGRLHVKSGTVVRFMTRLEQAQPEPQLEVEQGELTLESGDQPLAVRTSRGVVRVSPATTLRVQTDSAGSRFDVEVGRVDYTLHGQTQVVEAGHSFELDVLGVSVETQRPNARSTLSTAPPSTLDAAAPDAGVSAPTAADSERESFQSSPPTALLTFSAGESITVHDPSPPTDIALDTRCSSRSVLELDRGRGQAPQRFRGTSQVRARVAAGQYRYRLRCGTAPDIVATGQLKIVLDAATRPLPLAPVTVTADADGRRYTVSYQNRLPVITLRWPYAPRASTYKLVVAPAHGQQFTSEASQSTVTLPSGRLGEGVHHFWFETPDGKRSETGTLKVSFDYTARTAYLTSPIEGGTLRDQSAIFAGGALLGARVQLQDAALPLDLHGRFSGTTNIPPEANGAAVRVQSPTAGIHYYVRHISR